ncbi:MAG: DUF2126 domain-containing protein [Candidatus Binatia bacterium]
MSIHVALRHVTTYRYDREVALSPQVVRLRPAPHCRTPILSYSLRVTPGDHFLNWQQDPQSNYLARVVYPDRVRSLRVEVDLVAEMAVYNPFDFFLEPHAESFPFAYEPWQLGELDPFLRKEDATPRFSAWLAPMRGEPMRTIDFLVALTRRVQGDVSYTIRLEPGVQTKEQTLELGSGSCRDSAWLLVQAMRHLGLAARFVSGYLIQLAPDVKPLDGPAGPTSDFTDLHAWCEAYLPGAGWIGFDPTSGLLAGEGHIPLACTPEPASAAPMTGGVEKCETTFEHEMEVRRIQESPRVTRPYTDEQWAGIVALGHVVDEDFAKGDVRLTMGGEPTFVSVDDPDGDEWNTAAMGPTKRGLSADLLYRLKAHYAPGGFVHFGQGKWYPGEPLPRWALGCYWRRDGEAAWMDPELIADEKRPREFGAAEAERFTRELAERLGVGGEHVEPAFEDAWYYLWRERQLPVNVDPFDSRLADEMERKRLARVFDHGLASVVGYALPLAGSFDSSRVTWSTRPWFLRAERLYLLPGDSPMGLRLPLDSLPWVAASDFPSVNELDPSAPRAPLPPRARLLGSTDAPGNDAATATPSQAAQAQGAPAGQTAASALAPASARKSAVLATDARGADRQPEEAPALFESAVRELRTAVCVEPRDGILHVFLPPQSTLEAYLALVAATEETAAALAMPVRLEGYPPPPDSRLAHFLITPDPGVIEVNIHPASSWEELVEQTTTLYEEAHQLRLGTEKFLLDGRHTGTGGGNHFVLGGATPLDSPFLRRPDLLRSVVSYWHNHPSLSYLFSGLFIGPTSQAPRVDEARDDAVYELELAFAQLPEPGKECAPWIVDRVLRNLLVDITGNTHRAEFCIDKLYSPDTASGRRGLLEMRAFEMPPHARMSLAQQLLIRALVAKFWREPYRASLVRWGTHLHDRFLLPHFLGLDFDDVMADLAGAGYPFDRAWFAPHFEFRFPRHGAFAARGIEVELRHALEPWHVLGEEGTPGGTARYVDSSVERMQVRVTGLEGPRFVVACNGRALPLQPTGRAGEFVAGVRFRAWQPPSCLHPTIGVHAPLTFDIVDTWSSRSLGGCRYHVANPGGLSHEEFPINSYEAESRRLARFFAMGHTPDKVVVEPVHRSPEFPFTLDLRT